MASFAVAFATLDALQKACDETARPEAANFRERAQLAALGHDDVSDDVMEAVG